MAATQALEPRAPGCHTHLEQPLLVVTIPNVDHAVAAAGGKGAVGGVEGDCMHRVDHITPLLIPAVALCVLCVFLLFRCASKKCVTRRLQYLSEQRYQASHLEGVLGALRVRRGVIVLHSHAALHAAECVAARVSADHTRLVLEAVQWGVQGVELVSCTWIKLSCP